MNGDDGLQFSGDPGLSEQRATEIHSYWDNYDQLLMCMDAMGFPHMSTPPIPRPILTESDYLNIEGEEYARTSFRVSRWLEYAGVRLSEMRGRLKCVQNELADLTVEHMNELRRHYKSMQEKKPAEAELKETVKLLPNYKALKVAEQNLEAAIERIEVEVKAFEKYGAGLSRQLTMRGQEIDLGGKGSRVVRGQRL
jgi:hypothetical protein